MTNEQKLTEIKKEINESPMLNAHNVTMGHHACIMNVVGAWTSYEAEELLEIANRLEASYYITGAGEYEIEIKIEID